MNRRERRLYERENLKNSNRKFDWKKISKQFKQLLLICFVFFVIIFSFSYYVVNNHNDIRKYVSQNPISTIAKVVSISGKSRSADYKFDVNGVKYTGSTFNSFNGEIGNEICIEYSSKDPNFNLYCNEKEMQSIEKDVIQFSFKMFGIMIIGIIGILLFQLMIGNKKLMTEITSRKSK
ncbi:MAG: hypothetical protein O9282_08285 [Flavobacterium sp.]|uniref:hypothetical protein n=1 Tax=Flavobacterium sp. TaxID=239 RepID=UPI0022CD01E5|nr:hypothetical protein [Flavobacterium sp.]MCZ8331295.1 hypothetical protein [Flavobacterium sp.]